MKLLKRKCAIGMNLPIVPFKDAVSLSPRPWMYEHPHCNLGLLSASHHGGREIRREALKPPSTAVSVGLFGMLRNPDCELSNLEAGKSSICYQSAMKACETREHVRVVTRRAPGELIGRMDMQSTQ
jgi:hypothetical protein